MMPTVRGMAQLRVDQGPSASTTLNVGIEIPLSLPGHPRFQEHAVSVSKAEMEETLLPGAIRIGTENHLHGEFSETINRIAGEEQAIVTAVETQRLSEGAVYNLRFAEGGDFARRRFRKFPRLPFSDLSHVGPVLRTGSPVEVRPSQDRQAKGQD